MKSLSPPPSGAALVPTAACSLLNSRLLPFSWLSSLSALYMPDFVSLSLARAQAVARADNCSAEARLWCISALQVRRARLSVVDR